MKKRKIRRSSKMKEIMKKAARYRKEGMSPREALRKAWGKK